MTAGFNYYRAVIDDIADARTAWADKLTLPVLAVGGQYSFGNAVGASIERVANNVRPIVIEGAGHWIPDETPAELAAALVEFLG